MSAAPPDADRRGEVGRAPWAEGSVPLRGHGEEAERERRLEIVAARRGGRRRARAAALGGLAILLGVAAVGAANLSTGTQRLSGALVLTTSGGVAPTAPAGRSAVAAAIALTSPSPRDRRLDESDGGHELQAAAAAAAEPVPEATYAVPQAATPASEPEPAPTEPAAPPADASGEFGFEH